jgi:hypothetical protein
MEAGDCYRAKHATISFRCETNGAVGGRWSRKPGSSPGHDDDAMCNAERRQSGGRAEAGPTVDRHKYPPHSATWCTAFSTHQPALGIESRLHMSMAMSRHVLPGSHVVSGKD